MMMDSLKVNAVFLCISCKCELGCLHFPFSDEWMEFAQSYTVIAQYNCCAIGCIRYCLLVFILITCKCNIELDVYMFWVPWVAVYIFSRIFWKIWYSMILDEVWIGGKLTAAAATRWSLRCSGFLGSCIWKSTVTSRDLSQSELVLWSRDLEFWRDSTA